MGKPNRAPVGGVSPAPTPVEAVIFDIGGVLELTPPTGWQDRWAARLELDRAELDRRLEPAALAGSTGAMSLRQVEQAIASALGLGPAALEELMDDLWSEYLGTLNEPLADYFTALRPRYRTGILSNSFVGARERERERYGFEDICDTIVYSHEEGVLKPDPRAYRIACDRLGVKPPYAVLLDDVEGHVEAARAAGMQAIVFTATRQAIEELDQLLAAAVPPV